MRPTSPESLAGKVGSAPPSTDRFQGVTHAAGKMAGVADIWADMRARWARGEPVHAEDYLTPSFLAECHATDPVDVIYAEFVLAEEYGEDPQLDDFLRRFPQYATDLRKQILFHGAFANTVPSDERPANGPRQVLSVAGAEGQVFTCPCQFGRYLLVAPLDSGGQSTVYRAVHPDLGHEVVVKIARRSDRMQHDHRQRLLAEARLLAGLSHPHLARVHDAGEVDGHTYLVLEYVRGQTLAQFSRQARPSPEEAVSIVAKIARALAAVHAVGILHLDVKPKNIAIDDRGQPRLLDFGLARTDNAWTSAPEKPEWVAGTLQFMSPEQAQAAVDQYGPRTDIFALGAVLYFLLVGRPLYEGGSLNELLETVRTGRWDPQELDQARVDSRLKRICQQALQIDPEHRYQDAAVFAAELETWIRTARFRRKWGVALWALASLAVVASLGVAATSTYFRRAPEPSPGASGSAIAPPGDTPQPAPIDLTVQVWRDQRWWPLSQAAPLRTGNELQIQAAIPPHCRAVLVLLSSEGKARILQDLPAATIPQMLRYPSDDSTTPLVGSAGTESLLVVCSDHDLPSATEWDALCQSNPDWPPLSDYSILRLTPHGVTVEQAGRDLGPPIHRPTPESVVKRRLESIQQFLSARGASFEAVAFAHVP